MTTLETTDRPAQLTLFDLEALESRIKKGLAVFIEVGEALAEIQRAEGYRLRGYKSLEAYCEAELNFSLRHGQRLIQAAQAARKVEALTGEVPRNEAVAREIAKVAYSPDAGKTLRKVTVALRLEGKTLATATAEVVARVVTSVIHPTPKTAPTGGTQTALIEAPPPIQAAAPEFLDFCPNCGNLPASYVREADGWHCPDCEGRVAIGVVAITS